MPATDPTPPPSERFAASPRLAARWMWRDRLQFYTSLARRPEPILRFFIGPLPLYFVNAPTAIREVCCTTRRTSAKGLATTSCARSLARVCSWPRRRSRSRRRMAAATVSPSQPGAHGRYRRDRCRAAARASRVTPDRPDLRRLSRAGELTLQIISRGLVGVDLFVKPEARALIERLWRETNARRLDAPGCPFCRSCATAASLADRAALHAAIDRAIATTLANNISAMIC